MKAFLRPLHLAVSFLTTLPVPSVGRVDPSEFRTASGFYPAAGYVVGLVLYGVYSLAVYVHLPINVTAALVLSAWLWITGMLHFDGLTDSADAVLSMKSPEQRQAILKDVHIGAFGLATGVMVLLFKWSLLGSLKHALVLLLLPAISRFTLLIVMNSYPSLNSSSLGANSKEGNVLIGFLWVLPTLFYGGLGLMVVCLMTMFTVAQFAKGRLGGGINGDIYGACIEISEIAALLYWVVAYG